MSCAASSAKRGLPPLVNSRGRLFRFMRDYIPIILREALPSNIAILEECIQSRLAYAAAHSLNSVRGTIEGDGLVHNSFVLGHVNVGKNAVVANCIIDDKVFLTVEEGARVCDCSFHPTLLDDKTVPVFIIVGKDSTLFYVWSADSFTCCSNDVMVYSKIHEMGNTYHSLQAETTTIGDNCVIYGSFIDSRDDADTPAATRISIGKNAVIWQASLVANRATVTIADDLVMCDATIAMKLKHGKIQAVKSTDLNMPDIETLLSNIPSFVRLDTHGLTLKSGKKLYIGANVSTQHAFDKLKNGFIHLGDNVNIVQRINTERDIHTVQLNVHQLTVGNNVTLIYEAESWYSSRDPERNVEIGDDSTVVLTTSNGGFKGLDKKVPANSIVTL